MLEGENMKKILFSLLVFAITSSSFAAVLRESIAIEFQENGKFTGIIGKAYITETAVEVVTFAEQKGIAIPFAFIYTILEKENKTDKVYNVKCRNQLGVISNGTIDLRDRSKPIVTLTSNKGITITNISDAGRKMKKELLPKIDLGK
jgi:hypothetical protein